MGEIADLAVAFAVEEWAAFGHSTRSLQDEWTIVGNEADEPYRSRISHYWAVVGHPTWHGGTPKAWSGAFISWCFEAAGAGDRFQPDSTHSVYIDRIRRQDGTSPLLRLRPASRSVAPGDLIWNARGDDAPANHAEAIQRLQDGDFFPSHVDIVVALRAGECDTIGGNVFPPPPAEGGSVVRSTWRLDASGALFDGRKIWLGVVKNGL